MKQVSGTGSIVSGLSILCAAVCAECIPAMLGFVVLAGGGVLWDMLRGERVKHGVHMSGKVKSAGYKGRHEGIKNRLAVVGYGRDEKRHIQYIV